LARRENYWPHSNPDPADSESGQRTCSRGEWCYGRRITTEDGKVTITPAFTPRAYCEKCRLHIGECLSKLPSAYGRLEDELGEPSRRGDAVRIPFGPRLPLRENVDALLRLMAVTLCGWEARVRAMAPANLLARDPSKPIHAAEAVKRAVETLEDHLSVLLALQPAPMTRSISLAPGRHGMPAVICGKDGELIERLLPVAETDIMRLGVDYIATFVPVDGETAGREILQLHYRAQAILGECGQQAETLDGVPCRKCEDMALERAEPPSDPSLPAMWSQCASCRDQMSHEDFAAWAAMYAKWADDAAPTCKRCQDERCGECVYPGCACPAPHAHPARHAAVA
jgi:hypothetical protein